MPDKSASPAGLGSVLKTFPEILRYVTTIEAVLGLALLVTLVGSVFFAFAGVTGGAQIVIWVFAALVFAVLGSCLIIYGRSEVPGRRKIGFATPVRYDAYIAAPMEGLLPGMDYDDFNQQIKTVKKRLEKDCMIARSFYAGDDIEGPAKFHEPYVALEMNLEALRGSRRFILFYPQKLPSSIIFEAGLALAMGKPSVWFVRNRDDLPYLLRGAEQASAHAKNKLPLVRILDYQSFEDILEKLAINGERLFDYE